MAEFDKTDTYEKIVEVVVKKLSLDPSEITKEATFQDLGADSLDMFEILTRLQEVFGIEIDDDAADNITSLREAVEYIHSRRTK